MPLTQGLIGDKPFDYEELKKWILRRLGSPLLKVELTEAHLEDSIASAKMWFSAKKGVRKQTLLPFFSGSNEYILPDEIDTVLEVSFPVAPMDISMVFSPFLLMDEKVPYDVFAAPSSVGLYSSFTQTLQYVEMAKRILGAEPDWRQEGRTLYLFPIPRTNGRIFLDYKSVTFTIEQLNERDFDLLKRYALAKAMADLGRIRSKYDGYPTSSGETHLDGDKLLDEAKEVIEALDEEIGQSAYPIPFLSG
jgi:hypothetical protein